MIVIDWSVFIGICNWIYNLGIAIGIIYLIKRDALRGIYE